MEAGATAASNAPQASVSRGSRHQMRSVSPCRSDTLWQPAIRPSQAFVMKNGSPLPVGRQTAPSPHCSAKVLDQTANGLMTRQVTTVDRHTSIDHTMGIMDADYFRHLPGWRQARRRRQHPRPGEAPHHHAPAGPVIAESRGATPRLDAAVPPRQDHAHNLWAGTS